MSPEEKELFKRSISLAEQNNDILRSIQRSMRIARFMSMLYWVFIIGSAIGAYYIIQPYLEQLIGIYGSAGDVLDSFKNLGQ
jgi:hypothetical protein